MTSWTASCQAPLSLYKNNSANTTTENLWDVVKAVLRVKFIAIQAYLQKQEKKKDKQPNFTPNATIKKRKTQS